MRDWRPELEDAETAGEMVSYAFAAFLLVGSAAMFFLAARMTRQLDSAR